METTYQSIPLNRPRPFVEGIQRNIKATCLLFIYWAIKTNEGGSMDRSALQVGGPQNWGPYAGMQNLNRGGHLSGDPVFGRPSALQNLWSQE